MSAHNVELTRRAWEAWLRGDFAALFECFDPEIEWDTTTFGGWPEVGVYCGHDGVRRFFDEWLASWERFESGVDEYLDAGEDRVLVLAWQRAYGPGSHVPVEMEWAQLCTLRDGLVVHIAAYGDRNEALALVGLPAS